VLTRKNNEDKWTQITLIQSSIGKDFVQIFAKNTSLTVTPDHVMISKDKLIKAKDLKIGMFVENQEIQDLKSVQHQKKITVSTTEGTIIANGILTTTICGDYIDLYGDSLEVLEKWREDHMWLSGK